MSVDDLVKPEPDSGTAGPPYPSETELVRPMDAESEEGKGEGRAGQLELRAGTEWGRGRAGESRGLRVDDGEKRWRENVKRKWGQNSMGVWGKRESADRERRKWGENSMRVWGKRTPPPEGGNEKRKWGENTMGVWGKRSPEEKEKEKEKKEEETVVQAEIAPSGSTPEVTGSSEGQTGSSSNARRLSKRSVFEWYNDDDDDLGFDRRDLYRDLSKRSQGRRRSYPRPYGGPKRNWETNTMKVWGKRNYPNPWEEQEEEEQRKDYYEAEPVYGNKRKWTSDNAIRIWG